MTLRLLDATSSPYSSRCRMVVYAKDDGQVTIIEPPGGLYSDEYKAFHPFVKIPTLDLGVDSGDMLQESDVICEYLDDVLTGSALKPDDPLARARMRLIKCVTHLSPHSALRAVSVIHPAWRPGIQKPFSAPARY